MNSYIPYTTLLNNIYFPYYIEPIMITKDISTLSLEMDSNGTYSILNMIDKNTQEQILPFVDSSKFDIESKDWLWYDKDNFPFRLSSDISYILTPLWNIGTHSESINFISDILRYDPDGSELGFYGLSGDEKLYTGCPLIITINNKVVTDRTNYSAFETPILTQFNPELNPEFYYDIKNNKIITNQNLIGFDPITVVLYFWILPQDISVKILLAANSGDPFSTPMVDYYIIKMHGQNLRG